MNLQQQLGNLDVIPQSKKGEYLTCCPFCVKNGKTPDVDYKLGFNVYKKIYHCYRCGSKGSLNEMEQLLYLVDHHVPEASDLRNKLNGLFNGRDHSDSDSIDLDELSWPIDPVNTPIAFNYMIDRGFTQGEMGYYNIRVGKEGKWSGRVIFPFIENSICRYIVGRSINGATPRYVNSSGSKSSLVYNYDNIQNSCIICEGIISSISAERATGIPSVALLGKSISRIQASKIRTKCKEVWLSLDGDCKDGEVDKVLDVLIKSGLRVWSVRLPQDKDPDDLKEDYLNYFSMAKRESLL